MKEILKNLSRTIRRKLLLENNTVHYYLEGYNWIRL